jgi:hypothetical protein
MPGPQVYVRFRPPLRRLRVRRVATFLLAWMLLACAERWAVPLAFPRDTRFGFGFGALHGALMPMALPGLLLGQNVEIYASNNSGRTYKLGYIAGINMCGLIFFGSAFWRLGKIASPSQLQR